jgi:formyltetrahydrofolate deformylase
MKKDFANIIFLGHCSDTVGLVAKISGFFAERGINILHLEEHAERGRFFIRIEGEGQKQKVDLQKEFVPLAEEVGMEYNIFDSCQKIRVALFCSQSLHCPLEILSRQITGALNIEVACIVSNATTIQPIAERLKIPFYHTPTSVGEDFESTQLQIIQKSNVDLVALARYMKILSPEFLKNCKSPIINIHHSFLPSFIGNNPYEMAYERGVKIVGATAHFVTEDLDEGPIISQNILPVNHALSVERMKQRGANIEKQVFADSVEKFSERKIIEWQGRTIVFQ